METSRAQEIASEFKNALGYTVKDQTHGLLVTRGKQTSFFVEESAFWRGIDLIAATVTDKEILSAVGLNPGAALGSITSEAKTAAARENAKKPRPNAQGKKKPRKPKE